MYNILHWLVGLKLCCWLYHRDTNMCFTVEILSLRAWIARTVELNKAVGIVFFRLADLIQAL